jgi:hypothetical protein
MVKPQTMLTQAFTQPQQNELLGGLKALPIKPSKCSPPTMSMIYLRKASFERLALVESPARV